MKTFLVIACTLMLASACTKKDALEQPVAPPTMDIGFPQMLVTELNDAEVKYQQSKALDLNRDGVNDLVFSTWYIGDPVEQEDELLFFAASGTQSSLLVRGENESPRFNGGEVISVSPVEGYNWYIVAQAELAIKNIGNTQPPYWEKEWKDATHKFLAVHVNRDNKLYYGWVELSMDTTNSKLILHRMAISLEPGRAVRTGK